MGLWDNGVHFQRTKVTPAFKPVRPRTPAWLRAAGEPGVDEELEVGPGDQPVGHAEVRVADRCVLAGQVGVEVSGDPEIGVVADVGARSLLYWLAGIAPSLFPPGIMTWSVIGFGSVGTDFGGVLCFRPVPQEGLWRTVHDIRRVNPSPGVCWTSECQ